MVTVTVRVELHAPYAASLKDKRMILRSLTQKLRRSYNVSVAEVDAQDVHQRIVLGIAAVSASGYQAQKVIDDALRLAEQCDAEIIGIDYV